jgi:hypothetical protein
MADRLTCADLTALEARLQVATPAPWAFDPEQSLVYGAGHVIAWFGAFNPTAQDLANVRFVASARADIQALLATLEGVARDLVSYAACKPAAVLCAWCGAQGRQVDDHTAECPVRRAAALLGA